MEARAKSLFDAAVTIWPGPHVDVHAADAAAIATVSQIEAQYNIGMAS